MNNNTENQQILDKLTANIRSDWQPIELPSKTSVYGDVKVEIKPWGFEEEKVLTSTSKKNQTDIINRLITQCTRGIEVKDLLIADKLFLLYKLREISYGNNYEVNIPCSECEFFNGLIIEINKLDVTYVPEGFQDLVTVKLPNAGVHVVIRHPKVKDEALFRSDAIISILHKFIVSVEGNDNIFIIDAFVKRLLSQDLGVLKKAILDLDFGLQTNIKFSCTECGETNYVDLPLTDDFFSVNSSN